MVFVHKSKFFLFVFFGQIKSENIVFEILDKNERFLDQKKEMFKRAKQGDFPKGIIRGFCPKIEIFLICIFWRDQVRIYCFLIFWRKIEQFLDQKNKALKSAKQ